MKKIFILMVCCMVYSNGYTQNINKKAGKKDSIYNDIKNRHTLTATEKMIAPRDTKNVVIQIDTGGGYKDSTIKVITPAVIERKQQVIDFDATKDYGAMGHAGDVYFLVLYKKSADDDDPDNLGQELGRIKDSVQFNPLEGSEYYMPRIKYKRHSMR